MDELHAIIALDQLGCLEQMVKRRQRLAELYQLAAADIGTTTQRVDAGNRHSCVHWVTCIDEPLDRGAVAALLEAVGIETRPYFGTLHLGVWGDAAARECLPVSENLAQQVLALPMSSELSEEDAVRVADALVWAANSGTLTAPDEDVFPQVGQSRVGGQ